MIFSVPADAGFTPKGSCERGFDYDYTRGTAYETKGNAITLNFLTNTYLAALQMIRIGDHFNDNNAEMAIHASTNVAIGAQLQKLGIEVARFTSVF